MISNWLQSLGNFTGAELLGATTTGSEVCQDTVSEMATVQNDLIHGRFCASQTQLPAHKNGNGQPQGLASKF